MGCRATDVLPSPPRGATASGLLSARPARIRRRGQVRHPDAGHPTPGGLTVGLFPTVSTFEHHGDSAGVRDSGSAGHVATALPQIPGITRVRADCSTPQRTRGPGETWSRPASPPKNPRSRGNTPATSELHPNEAKPTQLDQTDQFEWVSMAVTVGFEPTVGGYPTQLFESCTFGRSDTSPSSILRQSGACREPAAGCDATTDPTTSALPRSVEE